MYIYARISIKSVSSITTTVDTRPGTYTKTDKSGYCILKTKQYNWNTKITTHCTSCNMHNDYVVKFYDQKTKSKRNQLMRLRPSYIDGHPGIVKCYIDKDYITDYIEKNKI